MARHIGIAAATAASVAGLVLALPTSSTAAPQVGSVASTCHSFSESTRSWIGWSVENLSCEHAHQVGVTWSRSCHRSSSTATALTCEVKQHVDGHELTFHCSNKKGSGSPSHYVVHCHHADKKASFTFYPHGF